MQQPELETLVNQAKAIIAEHKASHPRQPRRRSPMRGVPGLLKLMDIKTKHDQKNQIAIMDDGSQSSRTTKGISK